MFVLTVEEKGSHTCCPLVLCASELTGIEFLTCVCIEFPVQPREADQLFRRKQAFSQGNHQRAVKKAEFLACFQYVLVDFDGT